MSSKNPTLGFSRLALAAAAALSFAGTAGAQSVPVSAAESPTRLWFVELPGKTVADGATVAAVQAEQTKFRTAARAAGVTFTERRSFNTLFNGLSIDVSPANRAKLAKLAGVKALYPVDIVQAPQPTVSAATPDMVAALSATGANIAQNTLGLTGAGIRVGIIDSGIEIDHPAFGGTGVPGTTPFPNARIVGGWDFVGDAYNAAGTTPGELTPVPDARPQDCALSGNSPITPTSSASGGHGTHVAGIVGANGGGILGVAPQASLSMYRVFGCYGSTSSDIIIDAMERALADGMHVVNLSLGARAQWPQYPTSQASARLAKKGVVMVNSAGNNGPGGSAPDALYAAGAPGVAEGAIGVASFDNSQRSFEVAGTPYGFTSATASPNAPTSGTATLARVGSPAAIGDACEALPAGSLANRVVLVMRGVCGFYNKALNVQNAGGIGMVLYNNTAGAISPTVAGAETITIPVVAITQAQGQTLDAMILAGTTTLTWTNSYVGYPYGTGGLMSGFSSYGLAPDLSFKPQLGAPGGGIVSTYPLGLGGTASLSGTSMSAPHVAGLAALVLQAVPTAALGRTSALVSRNAPPQINMLTRLMNTAKPKLWSGNPDLGYLEPAFRQGAGMADVVAAVQSQQFVVPGQIAAGESEAGPTSQRLTIRNDAAVPVTYTLGNTGSISTGPNVAGASSWNIGNFYLSPASVAFSSSTVTVPAKGMATVDATITVNPAALPARGLYGGYITLTPTGAGTPLVVPYAGLAGDYQSTPILNPTANGFPWLTWLDGTTYRRCAANGACTFSMASGGIPYVLLSLQHQARTLTLEAFDAATGVSRGVISEDHYTTRNTTPTGWWAFSWDGTTSLGVQPSGSYVIRVSALKPLGDASNPAHTETWTSPTFTINRP